MSKLVQLKLRAMLRGICIALAYVLEKKAER